MRVVLAWLDGIGPEEMDWPEVTNGMVVDRAAPSPALVTSSLPSFDRWRRTVENNGVSCGPAPSQKRNPR